MPIKDFRHWLEILEEAGEVAHITEKVDWDLEIGAIVEETYRIGGPALLFENIKDHENTFCSKFYSAALSTYPRIALMMGLPKDTPYPELIKVHRERIQNPIAPVIVDSGPVKENIIMGDDVDMTAFPAPKWHERDGGRYIGTFDGVVTRDPDTGWLNVGLYRRMVHDKRRIGCSVPTGQHIHRHFRKYKKMGKPMPIAVVNNFIPSLCAISCCPVPPDCDEYNYIGGMNQAPVELVKCETNDIMVPASAEIVYEGELSTDFDEFEWEGPFGEYTGYFTSQRQKAPVFTVNCITHRNDPVLQGTMEGIPINEDHMIESVNHSSVLWDRLDERIPGVKGVNVDASTGWANVFVQIDNHYMGQVAQVANGIWSNPLSFMVGNNVWVVDEDIDIYSLDSMMWAFAYRCDYKKDIHAFPGSISPLDPRTHPDDRTRVAINKGWRVLFDCTKPVDAKRTHHWFDEKYAPLAIAGEEITAKVRGQWEKYGIWSTK